MSNISMEPGHMEDFYYLLKAQERGANIFVSNCTGYYVRTKPPFNTATGSCTFEPAIVLDQNCVIPRKGIISRHATHLVVILILIAVTTTIHKRRRLFSLFHQHESKEF